MRSELPQDPDLHPLRRWALVAVSTVVVWTDLAVFTTGGAAHSSWRMALGGSALAAAYVLLGCRRHAVGLRATPAPSARFWAWTVVVLAAGSLLLLAAGWLWLWSRGEPLPPGQFGTSADLWPSFVRSVLQAPIAEELVYRLALCLPVLVVAGPRLAILVSGAVFAWLHVVYGNFAPNHVFAGLVLGWSYVRSGCLWMPMLLHALGNVQVFLLNVGLWSWSQP